MISPIIYRPLRWRNRTNDLKFRTGASEGERTVWIFSFTPVCTEPRVLRQCQALVDAGWRVVVFGHDGRTEVPDEWHFAELSRSSPYSYVHRIGLLAIRSLGMRLARDASSERLRRLGAKFVQGGTHGYRWIKREVMRFAWEHPELAPDLVISHDYFSAEVGHACARHFGARFTVDCHEYARGQYMHDPVWVKNVQPHVQRLQDIYLSRCDGVTTVCQGIAELLDAEQQLKRPVQVVRSVPFRNIQPFRPTGERITVLYLGEIYYMRGLHKAIKSMPLWRPEFDFVMQGNVDPAYGEYLTRLASDLGLSGRVQIRSPVPFDQIVPSANQADIGYFVHKDLSPQKRFVLPNKYFEYVMAGLALCVSNLPEMARFVHQYDFGLLVDDYDEKAIAATINAFTPETIDAMKKRSIAAAEELNWDREQNRMLDFYRDLAI